MFGRRSSLGEKRRGSGAFIYVLQSSLSEGQNSRGWNETRPPRHLRRFLPSLSLFHFPSVRSSRARLSDLIVIILSYLPITRPQSKSSSPPQHQQPPPPQPNLLPSPPPPPLVPLASLTPPSPSTTLNNPPPVLSSLSHLTYHRLLLQEDWDLAERLASGSREG